MKQNYNYRIEVEDGNNIATKIGSITSMCSGTSTSCSNSKKCSNCVNGSHVSYLKYAKDAVLQNTCPKCGHYNSSSGASTVWYYCSKCNPSGNTGSSKYVCWNIPKQCESCKKLHTETYKYIKHSCPTCSGHGYSKCTTHNKYGAHYYCSHSTTGTKHQ